MVWLITKKGNMEDLKYTSVDWSQHFYLDASSPSGLRRTKDVYSGPSNCHAHYKKGDVVGSKRWHKNKTTSYGWQVTFNKQMYRVHRIIYVMTYGTIEKGLVIDHVDGDPLNNKIENLCLKTVRANSQNQKYYTRNASGVKGVIRKGNSWLCFWNDISSKMITRSFSIDKYGDLALEMAISCRINALTKLNEAGMEYTDRHINNVN